MGWLEQTCLATGHHAEVSALAGRGDRCIPYPGRYSPAFACSAILYLHRLRQILQPDLSRIAARLRYRLTLFRATSTSQEDSAYLPMIVLSACSHQAGEHPITYRFGLSLSVDLAHLCFTTVVSDSLYVSPLAQPSTSAGSRLPASRDRPHGRRVPRRAATLSVRLAPGRYQPRTAPRLLVAEHRVACGLGPEQQLVTRLAPRSQPDPAPAWPATLKGRFLLARRHFLGLSHPHFKAVWPVTADWTTLRSHAWEARTLPLSYTRPVPRDRRLPRRTCPLGMG